ncbi:MAG: hypothetical protein HYY13_10770 [Nitrospirae bacterium]|nr:hypothetical protein [Nitrospirota bacterium]
MSPQNVQALALVHFSLAMLTVCLWLSEGVVELYAYLKKRPRAELFAVSAVHYWIDVLVEFPILIAVAVTGIWLAVAIPHLTTLHIVKILLFGGFALLAFPCPLNVVKRFRLVQNNGTEEEIEACTRNIVRYSGSALVLFFVPLTGIGFYFALQRFGGEVLAR